MGTAEPVIAYAIDCGKGQFLSSFSLHTSGKKGTTIDLSFCESVANSKKSSAILYPYEDALRVLSHLQWVTIYARKFSLTKCVNTDGEWSVLP